MVSQILTSVIRTIVPAIVGVLVAGLSVTGLHLDSAIFTPGITLAVTGGYYAAVRWLEVKVGPKFGWLLGKQGAPLYVIPAKVVEAAAAVGVTLPAVVVTPVITAPVVPAATA